MTIATYIAEVKKLHENGYEDSGKSQIPILCQMVEILYESNARVIRNSNDILAKKACSLTIEELEALLKDGGE